MARSRRRTRLRCTAVPTRFESAYATRRPAGSGLDTKVKVSGPRRTRMPSDRSDANVRRSPTDPIRPTVGPDPSVDGCGELPAPPASTCAYGSRGSSPACGHSADRCASLVLLRAAKTNMAMGARLHTVEVPGAAEQPGHPPERGDPARRPIEGATVAKPCRQDGGDRPRLAGHRTAVGCSRATPSLLSTGCGVSCGNSRTRTVRPGVRRAAPVDGMRRGTAEPVV